MKNLQNRLTRVAAPEIFSACRKLAMIFYPSPFKFDTTNLTKEPRIILKESANLAAELKAEEPVCCDYIEKPEFYHLCVG